MAHYRYSLLSLFTVTAIASGSLAMMRYAVTVESLFAGHLWVGGMAILGGTIGSALGRTFGEGNWISLSTVNGASAGGIVGIIVACGGLISL